MTREITNDVIARRLYPRSTESCREIEVRLEDVIEIDEVYPHAGNRGFKKEPPAEKQA